MGGGRRSVGDCLSWAVVVECHGQGHWSGCRWSINGRRSKLVELETAMSGGGLTGGPFGTAFRRRWWWGVLVAVTAIRCVGGPL
eukprot:SAG11_NODE_383_length_9899_cov_10.535510_10_plen_84_part_00